MILGQRLGVAVPLSTVKTEENWSVNISAYSLGSSVGVPYILFEWWDPASCPRLAWIAFCCTCRRIFNIAVKGLVALCLAWRLYVAVSLPVFVLPWLLGFPEWTVFPPRHLQIGYTKTDCAVGKSFWLVHVSAVSWGTWTWKSSRVGQPMSLCCDLP